MTQRSRNALSNVNMETYPCEKYMARLLQRQLKEKAQGTSSGTTSKRTTATNQISKMYQNVKQQNDLPIQNMRKCMEFNDESAFVEVTVKTKNPTRQRSRSITTDKEPWGQVLNKQKSNEKISLFGNFDPLRTLHFLAKELQIQLQTILPDDNTVQQIISDIQYALHRVPPEVASTVHLQQNVKAPDIPPEKLKIPKSEKNTQTYSNVKEQEEIKLYKLMEQNSMKLEESCKQMEVVCMKLKEEKENLERQLNDLKNEVSSVMCPKMVEMENANRELQSTIQSLKSKYENRSISLAEDYKLQLAELKASKNALEDECTKLKHQLRLSTIEKEKYIAILAVRDKQVSEIRSEMIQLQKVINDQLLEMEQNERSVPNDPDKENIGDGSISTIYSNEDRVRQFFSPDKESSFRDIPSGDATVSDVFDKAEELLREKKNHRLYEPNELMEKLERMDSQASIRSMFKELKKTAYAMSSNSKINNQLLNNGE